MTNELDCPSSHTSRVVGQGARLQCATIARSAQKNRLSSKALSRMPAVLSQRVLARGSGGWTRTADQGITCCAVSPKSWPALLLCRRPPTTTSSSSSPSYFLTPSARYPPSLYLLSFSMSSSSTSSSLRRALAGESSAPTPPSLKRSRCARARARWLNMRPLSASTADSLPPFFSQSGQPSPPLALRQAVPSRPAPPRPPANARA